MWTLEKAREDYDKNNPPKPLKRRCENCEFHCIDCWDGSIGCKVTGEYVLFQGLTARRCKYYMEER